MQNRTGSLFIFQFISEWTFCSYGLLTKHGRVTVLLCLCPRAGPVIVYTGLKQSEDCINLFPRIEYTGMKFTGDRPFYLVYHEKLSPGLKSSLTRKRYYRKHIIDKSML